MMGVNLTLPGAEYTIDTPFEHAADGGKANFSTQVRLSYDHLFLKVKFECDDNFYTHENSMTRHNEPLYNQEVFEVFIGVGEKDPAEYLEVEINPNGALWIGRIVNPEPGKMLQRVVEQTDPETAGIRYDVQRGKNAWAGFLHIPWSFMGMDAAGQYRLNFYRIRSRVSHAGADWQCDPETCDFVCWSSTHSGAEPAFHRPRHFGHLRVGDKPS